MRAAASSTATATAAAVLVPRLKSSTTLVRLLVPRRGRGLVAMAAAAASFRPEAARSPPAIELPTPPVSKVTTSRLRLLFFLGQVEV
jgi:omega-amidase